MTAIISVLPWNRVLAAVANHIWQSTCFALAVASLASVLYRSPARVRLAVLFTGLLKFAVPLSSLVWAGRFLATPMPVQTGAWFAAAHEIGQPFTLQVVAKAGSASSAVMLSVVWLCGVAIVIVLGAVRWRRVLALKAGCTVMAGGREVDILRRMEKAAGFTKPMPVLVSAEPIAPGVLGTMQPVLIWPAAISAKLGDEHLSAILAHELEHVRHRDNLLASFCMWMQAIFWFHPLIWWLSARTVEERERACDEAVVAQRHAPEVYAESILRTCEFCAASAWDYAGSAATGGNLKQRVLRIMAPRRAERLSALRNVLLVSAGVLAVAAPIFSGVLAPPVAETQTDASAQRPAGKIYHAGGDVLPPKVLQSADPEYTDKARRAKYQGVCVVALVVDAQGQPQGVHVVRHLKMGLDEKAVEAVKQYRFAPGSRNGEPVAVALHIEVNYRVY